MGQQYEERRSRVLSDEDVAAIVLAFKKEQSCTCPFTPDEVSGVRALLVMMNETKSTVIKGAVGAFLAGMFIVMLLGAKVWVKQ